MEKNKKYIAWTIRIVVSFLFILSAIAKLSKAEILDSPYFAISTFEVKQLYTLGFSESIAPYFSRILIGIELALGLLLLQNNWLKRFIVPITILMLAVFVGHLTYVTYLSGGNTGNCGCFGELLPMTPIEAIIKNIVAIGLLAYLYYILPKPTDSGNFWILTTVLFASILWLFMLAPIQPPATEFTVSPINESVDDRISDGNPIVIDSIQSELPKTETVKETTEIVAKPEVVTEKEIIPTEPKKVKSGYAKFHPKIDQGKQLLAFFAPGCEHCEQTAKELTEMRKADKTLPPLSIIFMDEEAFLIPQFFERAGATYPYKVLGIIPFWNTLGSGKNVPGIKYLWNGNTVKFNWGIEDDKFNATDFKTVIKKDYEALKKTNPKL